MGWCQSVKRTLASPLLVVHLRYNNILEGAGGKQILVHGRREDRKKSANKTPMHSPNK